MKNKLLAILLACLLGHLNLAQARQCNDALTRHYETATKYYQCYLKPTCSSMLAPQHMYDAWKRVADYDCQTNQYMQEATAAMQRIACQFKLDSGIPCTASVQAQQTKPTVRATPLPPSPRQIQPRQQAHRPQKQTTTKGQGSLANALRRMEKTQKEQQQAIRRLNTQVASLQKGNSGNDDLLTLSYVSQLQSKVSIQPGNAVVLGGLAAQPRGQFRIALWVNVAGHADTTMNTAIEIYRFCPGCPATKSWQRDDDIGRWTIYGRDWGDNYVDLNLSKISNAHISYAFSNFRIHNLGPNTLEVFGFGIIQKPSSYFLQKQ
jgi:hypothetical protein